jgi:hypothetical protein
VSWIKRLDGIFKVKKVNGGLYAADCKSFVPLKSRGAIGHEVSTSPAQSYSSYRRNVIIRATPGEDIVSTSRPC